jgi:glycosyltransferase involved in cell wall biosynthesis
MNVMALGIDSSKIWIQRNFHKLPRVKQDKKYSDQMVIMTASRIVEHKRIDQLLEALANFENRNWKLIVCGDGPNLEELKNLTKILGIEGNVSFTGIVSRDLLFELMQQSDLYVSWSSEEGAPNVFIEALHFGLPVISANVGGVSEMIRDGFNGILLDPNDSSLISKAINGFFNQEKLMEFSRNAVDSSNLYDFDKNGAEFLSKMRELEKD